MITTPYNIWKTGKAILKGDDIVDIGKAGKAGYNLAKGSPAKNIQKIDPYIAEGILSNIK